MPAQQKVSRESAELVRVPACCRVAPCGGQRPQGSAADGQQAIPNLGIRSSGHWQRTMCRKCVKVEFPQRGGQCYEICAYIMNYKGCASCGKRGALPMSKRQGLEVRLGALSLSVIRRNRGESRALPLLYSQVKMERDEETESDEETVTFWHKCPG